MGTLLGIGMLLLFGEHANTTGFDSAPSCLLLPPPASFPPAVPLSVLPPPAVCYTFIKSDAVFSPNTHTHTHTHTQRGKGVCERNKKNQIAKRNGDLSSNPVSGGIEFPPS